MKKQVSICLKTAWLAAAAAIFLMGTTICVSSDAACVQAGNTMFALMLLMTFPTGVFFFLITAIFVDPGSIHQPSDFITAWFVMMCGGLLQWFLMVPGLFEKPGLTSLNLETSATLPSRNDGPALTSAAPEVIQAASLSKAMLFESPAAAQPKPVQIVSDRARTRRKSTKPIRPFDRTGRTPLERVIDHL
jgi:hypothetical protein